MDFLLAPDVPLTKPDVRSETRSHSTEKDLPQSPSLCERISKKQSMRAMPANSHRTQATRQMIRR